MACCEVIVDGRTGGSSSGAGFSWMTILDFDFTAQADQNLDVTGGPPPATVPETIGGQPFHTVNSIACELPNGLFRVENGNGVRIKPNPMGGLQWAGPALANLGAPGIGVKISDYLSDFSLTKYWLRCWQQFALVLTPDSGQGCWSYVGDIAKRANILTNICADIHRARGVAQNWQVIGESYGQNPGALGGEDLVDLAHDVVRFEVLGSETSISIQTGLYAGGWPNVALMRRRRLPPARAVDNTAAPNAYWDGDSVSFFAGLLQVPIGAARMEILIKRMRVDVLDVSQTT